MKFKLSITKSYHLVALVNATRNVLRRIPESRSVATFERRWTKMSKLEKFQLLRDIRRIATAIEPLNDAPCEVEMEVVSKT
jgi:hypothetical protein